MKKKKTLLIGGSGNLGLQIIKSKIFKNIYAPKKVFLNLLNPKQINQILKRNKITTIINCASIARMKECEKNVGKAINNNIEGTYNLVKAILEFEKNKKIETRIINTESKIIARK